MSVLFFSVQKNAVIKNAVRYVRNNTLILPFVYRYVLCVIKVSGVYLLFSFVFHPEVIFHSRVILKPVVIVRTPSRNRNRNRADSSTHTRKKRMKQKTSEIEVVKGKEEKKK